ncbi:MAG: dephospho-CoA kinase [Actinomycetes bacterium]|jgi:dephospho-CoA kinase|nr:dephospho-CoA kinase [Actinomycetes bacterium]
MDARTLVITGPFAAGKTLACTLLSEELRARGQAVRTLSLDEIGHQLLTDIRSEYVHALTDAFGDDILVSVRDEELASADANRPGGSKGVPTRRGVMRVDRGKLARRAFASAEATARLNALTHPAILARARALADAARAMGERVIIESPLPMSGQFEDALLWTISAPQELRLERACARGVAEMDVLTRFSAQPADTMYTAEAERVFPNVGTKDELREALRDAACDGDG